VSIDIEPVTDVEMFPAASVCTADSVHTPSTIEERSHVDPTVEPVTVQTTSFWNTREAVTVTVPPFSEATMRIVGVLSFVIPSEELVPVSLEESRATETGADGAVVSTDTLVVETTDNRF
jgi:hypothetical protein